MRTMEWYVCLESVEIWRKELLDFEQIKKTIGLVFTWFMNGSYMTNFICTFMHTRMQWIYVQFSLIFVS